MGVEEGKVNDKKRKKRGPKIIKTITHSNSVFLLLLIAHLRLSRVEFLLQALRHICQRLIERRDFFCVLLASSSFTINRASGRESYRQLPFGL
jgi:hypothetical protein